MHAFHNQYVSSRLTSKREYRLIVANCWLSEVYIVEFVSLLGLVHLIQRGSCNSSLPEAFTRSFEVLLKGTNIREFLVMEFWTSLQADEFLLLNSAILQQLVTYWKLCLNGIVCFATFLSHSFLAPSFKLFCLRLSTKPQFTRAPVFVHSSKTFTRRVEQLQVYRLQNCYFLVQLCSDCSFFCDSVYDDVIFEVFIPGIQRFLSHFKFLQRIMICNEYENLLIALCSNRLRNQLFQKFLSVFRLFVCLASSIC